LAKEEGGPEAVPGGGVQGTPDLKLPQQSKEFGVVELVGQLLQHLGSRPGSLGLV
jgi:hypothetical protein